MKVDRSALPRHLSIAQVLSQLSSGFLKPSWEDGLLPYLACRGTSHGHHHQQF